MSVLEKINEIHSTVENISKEKPIVTVVDNFSLSIENYNMVKFFHDFL